MARQPVVSRGWTGTFTALEAVGAKGRAVERAQLQVKADIGFTWTNYTNTLVGVLPDTLARARGHASRMMQAVR